MASTYITIEQRFAVIESLVDAMIEVGHICEDQANEVRIELGSLNNSELKAACDDWCPEEWSRILGTRERPAF